MSLYRQGMTMPVPFRKGSHYRAGLSHVGGPWVSTPGLIEDEINRLQTDVKAADRDIYQWLSDNGAFPENMEDRPEEILPAVRFYEGTWSEFLRSWEDFMSDKSPWYNRLWGHNYSDVQDWRKKLIDLRAAWKTNLGVQFVGPEPSAPKDDTWGLFSGLKTVAIIAAVVLGGFVVVWLLGQFRGGGMMSRPQPIVISKGVA